MKEYNIPEDHIFNSHDIQFEQQIISKTKGKGVNLVLNSLTGEKLEASFRCVSDDGRFVEIGKYDLQMNKQLGMFAFLRNISFHGVMADRMLYLMENKSQKFFKWLHENPNNGCIKPINRTVFKRTEAEHAFRYRRFGITMPYLFWGQISNNSNYRKKFKYLVKFILMKICINLSHT
jgi:fatty acid synthase